MLIIFCHDSTCGALLATKLEFFLKWQVATILVLSTYHIDSLHWIENQFIKFKFDSPNEALNGNYTKNVIFELIYMFVYVLTAIKINNALTLLS